MPNVTNGIGTWYYGRANRFENYGVCEECHAAGTFQSYDTTLYFVFFFYPLFPLRKVRVLHCCPACKRHRAAPLADWRELKEKDLREAAETLLSAAGDTDKAREAIAAAAHYQDYALFRPVADIARARYAGDPAVLNQLGAAQSYFRRYPEAEKTVKQSLEIKDDDDARELLADILIRQGKLDEAEARLAHVVEREIPDLIDCLLLLARARQSRGQHAQALKVFGQCADIMPDLAADGGFQRMRKNSEDNLESGKPVETGVIPNAPADGPGAEGGGGPDLAGRLAKVAGPALLAVILGVYLFFCFHLDRHQTLYLASGLDRPYAVTLDGATHELPPFAVKRIERPSGRPTFAVPDLGIEPTVADLSTNFFLRPFRRPTLILNPDGGAVFRREKAYYAGSGEDAPAPEFAYLAGQYVYRETGLRHEFEDLPEQVRIKRGRVASRTRIATISRLLFFDAGAWAVWGALEEGIGRERSLELAKRLVGRASPAGAPPILAYLGGHLEPEAMAAALEPALDAKPVSVDLHRFYQDSMRASGRADELRDRYAGYMERDAASVWKYLYFRTLDDRRAGMALLRAGIEQPDPSPYCFHALAYEAMRGADFGQALEYSRRAATMEPNNLVFASFLENVLLANGRYDEALEGVAKRMDAGNFEFDGPAIVSEMRLLVLQGQTDEAERRLKKHFAGIRKDASPSSMGMIDAFENRCLAMFYYCAGRLPEFLAAADKSEDPALRLQAAVTRRDPAGAEKAFAALEEPSIDDLLLMVVLAGAENDADAFKRYQASTAEFMEKHPRGRNWPPASMFAGERPEFSAIAGMDVDPGYARHDKQLFAVAAGLMYPELRKECFALADKLNYNPLFPQRFLRDIVRAP